jgi:hypothetical protein
MEDREGVLYDDMRKLAMDDGISRRREGARRRKGLEGARRLE